MILRRALVALGIPAVACSSPAPAHRGRSATTAAAPDPSPGTADSRPDDVAPPTTASEPATSTPEAEAPTTTAYVVTLPTDPPTTTTVRPRPLPTTTLREAETDEDDGTWWANQPGYSGVWPALAMCESHNRNVDTGNGYSGFFQFSDATWRSMNTGYARAVDAPYAVQLDAAQRLQARNGWGQWPACSRQLGLS